MTRTKSIELLLSNEPGASLVKVYPCQKNWDELQTSGDEDVRYCDSCQQAVHRVIDVEGFQRAVARGRCVMIEGRNVVSGEQVLVLGEPGAAHYEVSSAKQV